MTLSEALEKAKEHIEHEQGTHCLCVEDLVAAVEEHLEAERKSAETLLCLADLQRHGGE